MNKTDMELLINALSTGIIDLTEVREQVETMNRKQMEKIYEEARATRKVWKGEGKDQRWKFKKKDGSLVVKTSEDAIREAYIKYYEQTTNQTKKESYTFADIYKRWLDYRSEMVGTKRGQLSPSTYKRYINDYNHYIKGSSFDKMKVVDISAPAIEKYLKEIVIKYELTKSALINVAGYIKGALFLAYKEGLIEKTPYPSVDLKPIRGFCRIIVKYDEDRVLTLDEMKILIETLHEKQKNKETYIQNYAIELATMTGMRVGELAALKWESIQENGLHIDFSEHRLDYEDKSSEYIVGEPKNSKHRVYPITDEIQELLNRIKAIHTKYGINSEYVFADKSGRVNGHTISCAVNRRCNDAGIDKRSIHAIRRTVSSYLRTRLPIATVANLLGHLEETNDKCYHYDISNMNYKKDSLQEMFQSFKTAEEHTVNEDEIA